MLPRHHNNSNILADRTARSMIGSWHNFAVCLSVCLWRCALWRSGFCNGLTVVPQCS